MQPLCLILKKLYGISQPCNNLRRRSEKCHNSHHVDVNINKKLHDKYSLTFNDRHQKAFQESQVHNKCFCSIITVIYVQIPYFVSAFGIHIQTLILVSVTSDKNFKKLYYRSKKLIKVTCLNEYL